MTAPHAVGEPSAEALLETWTRSIPDWPEPGVTFRDLTPLFADAHAFADLLRHPQHVQSLVFNPHPLAARARIDPGDVAAGMPDAEQSIEPVEVVEHLLERTDGALLVRGPGTDTHLRAHALPGALNESTVAG